MQNSNSICNLIQKAQFQQIYKPTVSYKGNRWGCKPISKQVRNKIMEQHKAGYSIRKIASQVNIYDSNKNGHPISIGAVH
jgi:hypothetical protein